MPLFIKAKNVPKLIPLFLSKSVWPKKQKYSNKLHSEHFPLPSSCWFFSSSARLRPASSSLSSFCASWTGRKGPSRWRRRPERRYLSQYSRDKRYVNSQAKSKRCDCDDTLWTLANSSSHNPLRQVNRSGGQEKAIRQKFDLSFLGGTQ